MTVKRNPNTKAGRTKFKARPEPACAAHTYEIDLRDPSQRLEQLSELYDHLVQTREARASIAVAAGIPGGDSGLFVRHTKMFGSGDDAHIVEEFVIDLAFVRQMRTLLQTAHQLDVPAAARSDEQSADALRLMRERRKRVGAAPTRPEPACESPNPPPGLAEHSGPKLPSEHGCDSNTSKLTPRSVPLNIRDGDARCQVLNDLYGRLRRAIKARGHAAESRIRGGGHGSVLVQTNSIIGSRDQKHTAEKRTLDSALLGAAEALLRAAQQMAPLDDPSNASMRNHAVIEALESGRGPRRRDRSGAMPDASPQDAGPMQKNDPANPIPTSHEKSLERAV